MPSWKTYIALLYSVGIGDGRRLVMNDWRRMMEEAGFRNPRTLIATGNALFEACNTNPHEVEMQLEEAFERHFGRRVDTIVLPAGSFRRVVASNPFPKESNEDGARVAARIMREPLKEKAAVELLSPYLTQGERVKVVRGHLWAHIPGEPNRSRLVKVLASKRLGVGTVRNWNTVRRLGELATGN